MTRSRSRILSLVATVLACAALACGCGSRPSSVSALAPPRLECSDAFGPTIACSPKEHDLLLGWMARDSSGWRIWFSRSADHGASWSPPVAVSPVGEPLSQDPESSPTIVCDEKNRVGIAWTAGGAPHGDGARARRDVRFANSLDGGLSWNPPATVNDNAQDPNDDASHQDIALSTTDGDLFAAWLDSRPGADSSAGIPPEGEDTSIWMARSQDFGAHWGANVAHWSRACPSCRPRLVVDPSRSLFLTFRKQFEQQVRDVVIGGPLGPLVRMHADQWKLAHCPGVGPALTLSRDGTLRVAWFTDAPGRSGVWFRESVPELMDSTGTPVPVLTGRSLPAVHIGIGEAGMSGTLIACDADSTGSRQLTLARVVPSGRRVAERFVMPGTLGASYPGIASERASGIAYVAWTGTVGDHHQLRLARWDLGR